MALLLFLRYGRKLTFEVDATLNPNHHQGVDGCALRSSLSKIGQNFLNIKCGLDTLRGVFSCHLLCLDARY